MAWFRLARRSGGPPTVKSGKLFVCALLAIAFSSPALAQEGTWEFVFDLNYQDSYDIDFNGGSTADVDSDLGFGIGAAYNFNDHLQLQMLLDWLNVDYDSTIKSGDIPPDPEFRISGELEAF